MFVVMTFFVSRPQQMTPAYLFTSAIKWLIGGLLFGYVMWIYCERRYNRLNNEERRGDGGGVV
jgi:hypothetical protein